MSMKGKGYKDNEIQSLFNHKTMDYAGAFSHHNTGDNSANDDMSAAGLQDGVNSTKTGYFNTLLGDESKLLFNDEEKEVALGEEKLELDILEVDDLELDVLKAYDDDNADEDKQLFPNLGTSNPGHGNEFARVGHNKVRLTRWERIIKNMNAYSIKMTNV